jgi:hypothetical protein
MANSYVFYPSATGGQTDYAIPFAYLSSTFVKATVNGASVPFTFLSTSMIRFTTAPVGALKIYRQTTKAPVNTFINGSILVDDDLNGSFLQSLHIAEEVAESSMQTATDGSWDATNLKVKNVADPTNPQDVVNKRWAETVGNGFIADAGAKATAAAASAAAALADKNTVATDKGIVAGYKADVAADKATVAADKATTLGYKNAADADKVATSGDRTQTGLDRVATAADRVQTGLDRVATGNDKVATAADRVQTGLDRTAASNSAAAAAASAGSMTPVETQVHAATAKPAPSDADELPLVSSTSTPTWSLRKWTWADVKTALKTYFDTLYATVAHNHAATDITSGTLADARLPTRLGPTCQSIADANLATANGWYMGSNVANAPSAAWWLIETITHIEALWCIQTAYPFTTMSAASGSVQRRVRNNGTWSAWFTVLGHQVELDARYLQSANGKLQKSYDSGQQAITAGGQLVLAHGLGVKPPLFILTLQCVVAELGYSVGDEVGVNQSITDAGSQPKGWSIVPDATNVTIRMGSAVNNVYLMQKGAGGTTGVITNANWRLIMRAWA